MRSPSLAGTVSTTTARICPGARWVIAAMARMMSSRLAVLERPTCLARRATAPIRSASMARKRALPRAYSLARPSMVSLAFTVTGRFSAMSGPRRRPRQMNAASATSTRSTSVGVTQPGVSSPIDGGPVCATSVMVGRYQMRESLSPSKLSASAAFPQVAIWVLPNAEVSARRVSVRPDPARSISAKVFSPLGKQPAKTVAPCAGASGWAAPGSMRVSVLPPGESVPALTAAGTEQLAASDSAPDTPPKPTSGASVCSVRKSGAATTVRGASSAISASCPSVR